MRSILFYSILFYSILSLVSCADSYNEPVREYCEYWTTTCQVGKLDFSTEHVSMGGFPNLSARNAIEINLYTINPKGIKLLCKPDAVTDGTDGNGNFCLASEDGGLEVDNYSETLVDPTHIRIRANLRDDSEGQKITLSGCLWPENRAEFAEADLKAQSPELFYSQTFIQNTPPDNVKNMYVSDGLFSSSVEKCYLSFEVPDQSLKRNLDSKYEIGYYLRENDGKLYFKGSETLTLDQRRNPSGGNVFQYYFDGQEDDLTSYEYTVQVLGPHGRNSEKLSTDPSLGVCVLVEPTVTIVQTPNGLFDESYECYEVESASDSITFTATPGQEGDTLQVYVDGSLVTESGGHYTVSGSDQRHEIKVVSKKVGARAVTVTKKIRIEKTPDAAEIEFGKAFNGCGTDASGFEYIEVASLTGTVSYTATAPEAGTTVSVTDNGTAVLASGSLNVSSHTLVATVHKDFCNDVGLTKKVKVVRELQKPTYSFNPGLTGTKTGDFEWIEVADGSSYVTYTITAESGCTMEIKNSSSLGNSTTNTSRNTNTDTLVSLSTSSSRDYTLTITVKKPCYTDKTFTKKIKLIKALQEPTIRVYKNDGNDLISPSTSAPEESGYSAYTCYDMPLTTSGTGHANFEVTAAADGGSVSVKVDGANASTYSSGKRKLELGGHIITFTVTKDGYKTQEYNKKVYVQGTLAEPTIDSVNGSGSATGSGNSNTDPLVWKFSYLGSDNELKCKVSPGNTGNTIVVHKDTATGTTMSNPTTGFGVGYDTVKTLVIVQSKSKCKTLTTTKYVQGKIKPIKLTYSNNSNSTKAYMCIGGYDGEGKFNALGTIKVNDTTIWGWGQAKGYNKIGADGWVELSYGRTEDTERSVTVTCTSPSDKVAIHAINMRRNDGSSMSGDKSQQRTLSDMKSRTSIPACGYQNKAPARTVNKWTLWSGRLTDNTHYVYIYVTFVATEE